MQSYEVPWFEMNQMYIIILVFLALKPGYIEFGVVCIDSAIVM